MSIAAALKSRISVRAFLDKPVAEATLRAVLDMARWSPSGGNLQGWKVIAVAGPARDEVVALARRTMAANPDGEAGEHPIYPPHLGEPWRTRRYKVGEDMYKLLGVPREDRPARLRWVARNFEFFGAPVGLFFVIDRSMGNGQWAHLGMFMLAVALAAQEAGLGTCMQESWAQVRQSLHAHFKLASHELIYCGMAVGHADPAAPVNRLRSERAPVDEIAVFKGFAAA